MLTLKGVVLTHKPIGEQDRFIDILTADRGVIEVLVRGAAKISSKTGSATQLFAYSEFSLADRKGGSYFLNSVSPVRIFYGLRSSVTAVALASYFSQILTYAVLPKSGTPELLRLLLNCLHLLSEKEADAERIKCIFELRCAALLGFMPDVVMCRSCGAYLPGELVFSIENGGFVCKECYTPPDLPAGDIPMPAGSLLAVRHIVLSDFERIFSFRISERCREPLFTFSEAFLRYHLDRDFPALGYYHTITGTPPAVLPAGGSALSL